MDSKVTKLAVLTLISLFALIIVIVFATNPGRFGKLINGGSGADNSGSMSGSSGMTSYGVQIGDNLKGFIAESDFFDSSEKLEQIISEDVEAVDIKVSAGEGTITVRVYNTRGGLETGAVFKADVQKIGKAEKDEEMSSDRAMKNTITADTDIYTDADMDGIIEIDNLDVGVYKVSLQEQKGYHVPQTAERITITETAKKGSSTAVADNSNEYRSNSSADISTE